MGEFLFLKQSLLKKRTSSIKGLYKTWFMYVSLYHRLWRRNLTSVFFSEHLSSEYSLQRHIRPRFFFGTFRPRCQRANSKLDKCPNVSHVIPYKHNWVWVNSKRRYAVCKCRRAKVTRCENYTVYRIYFLIILNALKE